MPAGTNIRLTFLTIKYTSPDLTFMVHIACVANLEPEPMEIDLKVALHSFGRSQIAIIVITTVWNTEEVDLIVRRNSCLPRVLRHHFHCIYRFVSINHQFYSQSVFQRLFIVPGTGRVIILSLLKSYTYSIQ